MADIAADRYPQRTGVRTPVAQGQRVEQSLCRMCVIAVAGIEHGSVGTQMLRDELWCAGLLVAHDEGVAMHRFERVHRGVVQPDRTRCACAWRIRKTG